MPLVSFVPSPSVGVARMNTPEAPPKSFPRACAAPTVRFAARLETAPARLLVAARNRVGVAARLYGDDDGGGNLDVEVRRFVVETALQGRQTRDAR